jgi:hypothetical protein
VNGLAGSAAVALLVLTTINRPTWAIGYLLVFGLGTVAGMMLITAAIALPFAYSLKHFFSIESGFGPGFRVPEPLLRALRVLPHRYRGRAVHKPSDLDSKVGSYSSRSVGLRLTGY